MRKLRHREQEQSVSDGVELRLRGWPCEPGGPWGCIRPLPSCPIASPGSSRRPLSPELFPLCWAVPRHTSCPKTLTSTRRGRLLSPPHLQLPSSLCSPGTTLDRPSLPPAPLTSSLSWTYPNQASSPPRLLRPGPQHSACHFTQQAFLPEFLKHFGLFAACDKGGYHTKLTGRPLVQAAAAEHWLILCGPAVTPTAWIFCTDGISLQRGSDLETRIISN